MSKISRHVKNVQPPKKHEKDRADVEKESNLKVSWEVRSTDGSKNITMVDADELLKRIDASSQRSFSILRCVLHEQAIVDEDLRTARDSKERTKRHQNLLAELIAADLYEQEDGHVRKVLCVTEQIEMQNKLLSVGHQLAVIDGALKIIESNPLYKRSITNDK